MELVTRSVGILLSRKEVGPYARQVAEAADQNRESLGWFPFKVFEESATREKLIVAVVREGGLDVYAGHLLFETTFPRGHVLQIHVLPTRRRHGLATALLNHLKTHLTKLNFISIGARVAEDLREAQEFWQRQGFYVRKIVAGGKTRGRTLAVRAHELPTRQLFAPSGITHRDPLGLAASDGASATQLFLLDLNVLFDLGPRRARHDDVVDLFALERKGICRLALSTEFDAELARTARAGKTDPMQGFGRIFPKFAAPAGPEWDLFVQVLAPMVFPERHESGALTTNDLSDLRHLATAIQHNLAGLIASDGTIRHAAAALRARFGIEVVSPEAFKIMGDLDGGIEAVASSTRSVLDLGELPAGREVEVRTLLSNLDVSINDQLQRWSADDGQSRISNRFVVIDGNRVVGYLVWPKSARGNTVDAFIAVDEEALCAADAVRLMLSRLASAARPVVQRIQLHLASRQAVVREVATEVGFTGTDDARELHKVSLNRVLVPHNWTSVRDELLKAAEIGLPETMPAFRGVDQYVELLRPDGQRAHVTAFSLESLLSPALLCMPERAGVLVPIQREYSEHLLGHLDQLQLLPQEKALLYQQRHYLSAPTTLKVFTRGCLVFFYESTKGKGMMAVVAVARVVNAYLSADGKVDTTDLDRSVLERKNLAAIGKSDAKTVVAFDNVMTFPTPVPLATLKALGCGSATQLLTSRRLTHEQTAKILHEGFQSEHPAERPHLA